MPKNKFYFHISFCIAILLNISKGFTNSSSDVPKRCGQYQWQCVNGNCIDILQRCNRIIDCGDKSDEHMCGDTPTCLSEDSNTRCKSRECISAEMICDGNLDCYDHSDEYYCYKREQCPETICKSGECIHLWYLCDGENDCSDRSDEENCKHYCVKGYTPCNDGRCIPSHLFCNGQKDCIDNEDESKCGNVETCFTENGYYLCHDNSKCLKDDYVCDGIPHCNDESDEGGNCDMTCKDYNLSCNQGCFKTPSKPKCKCDVGYSMQNNNQTCQDINECELETQVCDHFCENNDGNFKCSCAEHYRLLEGAIEDNATCRITEPAMLLFSVGYEINGKMLDKSEKWIISNTTGEIPSSIAFDPKFEKVYWISNKERIYMKSLKGSEEPKVFLHQGLDNPENLAVDWLGRNIYITENKKSHILVCNLEAIDCVTLMTNISQPKFLQLDLEERYLYYTTITPHKIIKVGLDGKSSRVIINDNGVWVNGLALDFPAKRIFFVDAVFDKVESSNYEGKNRKEFTIEDVRNPYDLAVWQDRIYWIDWQKDSKKEIHSCRKRDGMKWESEFKDERREIRNILIYHTSMFKNIYNPCEDSLGKKCSHICFLSPTNPNGYVCTCPRDMKLRSDNHSCEDLGNFALVSVLSNIYKVPLKYYPPLFTTPEKFVTLNISNIVDMDYDPSNDEIYFADPKNESISKVSLKNGKIQKVIENIRFPTSLAVDWLRDNLYWINGVHHTIEVSRTSGIYRKKIANNIHSPTNIALDVTKGYIYISDNNVSPTINKCELNGSYCRVLVNSNISKITSLHVDITSVPRKIYWANAKRNVIESIDEYGENRILELSNLSYPVKINVNNDFIVWTEKYSNVLFFVVKNVNKKIRKIQLDFSFIPVDFRFMALTSVYSKPNNTKQLCFTNDRRCHQFCFSKIDLNMVCDCSQGLTLQSDGTSCLTQKCSSDEWMCDNGECIFNFTRCDGSVDCSDKSDEKNCSIICTEDEFQCKNGSCIERIFKCDGYRDCHDKSDEENCTLDNKKDCNIRNAWQCESGECLPYIWRCDGKDDCVDSSDEKSCDKRMCLEDKISCDNGNCIPLTWWCDGEKDCKSGEDEINCQCKLGEYKCKDGRCLDKGKLCRKEISCDSEEVNLSCPIQKSDTHRDCPLNFVLCDPLASVIKCIPFEGWCNKTVECPNKEDEMHCECDEDKVKCNNEEICIPRKWLCDKFEDCTDGSDEKGCFPLIKQKDQVEEYCAFGFKCADETCLSTDKVCDGRNDCDTGIDESGDCDKCRFNNGGCQHICHNYPTKVKCSCKTGFKLSTNGISCEDIDECENKEVCQHYCENIKGAYYCTCAERYTLRGDGTTCKSDTKRPTLLIVRNKKLDFYDEDLQIRNKKFADEDHQIGSISKLIIPKNFSSKTKYIYDSVNKKIIGIDGQDGVVYTESSGEWFKEIINVKNVKDIAFDYVNRNIYIVIPNVVYNRSSPKLESKEMGSTIQVYNLESKILGELLVVPDKNITSLDLSLKYSYMFTCENNETHGIILLRNLDGSVLRTMVDEKIIYCNCLAIDRFHNRIYWIDEALNGIESVDFNGSDRRKFLSKQIHRPRSLLVLNDHLFWFNSYQNAVTKCSTKSPNNCSVLSFFEKSETIILNIENFSNISLHSPCASSPCPHLCVPHLVDSHHCICAVGYRYENDNCTLATDPETGGIRGNCSASPCKFGTCVQLPIGLVTCKCTDGYEGTLCDIALKGDSRLTFNLILGLIISFIIITIIAAAYFYKKKFCSVSSSERRQKLWFIKPSFLLIEEESTMSETPSIPVDSC